MERLLLLLVGLSLAACSSNLSSTGHPTAPEADEFPMDPEKREAYLNSFQLTDLNGEEAAPRINDATGTTPFGVLVKLPATGLPSACSVSHLWSGQLVTNAHCVSGHRTMGIQNFFLVFYNREGQRTHIPVESLAYLGDTTGVDIAVLKISDEHAKQWDTLNAEVVPNPELAGQVTLWGFDPINLTQGGTGMAFSPKACLASRTKPQVLGVKESGERESVLGNVKLDAENHIFVDRCNVKLVAGNSGSLITGLNDSKVAFGVYHWAITPTTEATNKFTRFEYFGNEKVVEILPKSPPQGLFFGVGSLLRGLLPPAKI